MSWQPADRVVRLHGLVPDVLSSVFVELEMNNAGGVNGRYAISELDGMRIVRSSTCGGRFQVFRGDCHIRRTRSHSVFLCLPLSGNVIIQQNGRRGTIARGDLGLLDSRAEYEIDVFYLRRLGGPRRTWERACDYAERHLGDENLSPARIADAVGISTRYLSELFASQGTTTMEWVARRRLESCRAALESQSWAPGIITEIAFRSGFGNISSFNRSFKEAFGLAPRKVMRRPIESELV